MNPRKFAEAVFVRSGCAMILASVGGLAGLVAWGIRTAQSAYPRTPSSVVWATVGTAFGFVVGACIGNRSLTGRQGILVAGLTIGILSGSLIGWQWAHVAYSRAREQLLNDGVHADFLDAGQAGISVADYEAIGLQYGICLGVLAGTTGGWFWKHPPRLNTVANAFPVVASCFIALGAVSMNKGLCELSGEAVQQGRHLWELQQARETRQTPADSVDREIGAP
ncbi:MAG TPA: hypothetical protein VKU82_06185 [Planctomycetaceae bacterium]|nr:hypothetical protein [Planctomycetaceae bacterium]